MISANKAIANCLKNIYEVLGINYLSSVALKEMES